MPASWSNAHGDAELSLFEGAGHRLRHDPRAVAVLLGWLDRMRSIARPPGCRTGLSTGVQTRARRRQTCERCQS